MALHQQGRLADAGRIYEEVLREKPNQFDALHLLGVIALQTGHPERAIELIGKAIALRPDYADAHYNRGLALQDLKRSDDALTSYDRAIALKPDYAEAHNNRGVALRDLRRSDEALTSYDRAIALKHDYAEAHNNRGLALQDLKRSGVAMMPGKPTVLGVVAGKPVIGNPGYPVSAVLSFEQFAAPLIAGLAGKRPAPRAVLMVYPAQNLPSKPGLTEFIRVTLGRVGDKVIATPLPRGAGTITSLVRADGLLVVPALSEGLEEDRPAAVELLVPPADIDGTLVVLGSHDNTIDLLATLLRRRDHRLRLSSGHVGSLGGLMALRQGRAHLGGSHMLDPETNTYNVPFILRHLPGVPLKLINLAWREQGLMVAPGNPKQIGTISDLTRPGVRFINRQRGAGTRLLLDYLLKKAGMSADEVEGYGREEYTHMAVAVNVASGTADVGLGILAAARALGLDFIPLLPERYDLVVPEATFADPRFQTLLAVVRSREFQEAAAALGGYDLKDCGKILWEQ